MAPFLLGRPARSRRGVLFISVAVALALAGCSDDTGISDTSAQQRAGAVLTIEPDVLGPGDEVTVTFDPPADHIWGVAGELWSVDRGKRIAFTYGWAGRPQMKTIWPAPGGAFEDIGFAGKSSWTWIVPRRLEPGTYELRKDAISDEMGSLEDRTKAWSARFEVR